MSGFPRVSGCGSGGAAGGDSTTAARVVAVVVTYRPEDDCRELLDALGAQCAAVVVIDNGSGAQFVAGLAGACAASGAEFVGLSQNVGIAAAQNCGIERARELGATHVLLSDDDSLPPENMVARLLEGFTVGGAVTGIDAVVGAGAVTGGADTTGSHEQRSDETPGATGQAVAPHGANRGGVSGGPVAAVGPLPTEDRPGGDQLVYQDRGWSPKRATAQELDTDLLEVPFLIASGCLISLDALDVVGEMDESLFIDHVDLEWGLRARRAGYRLYCAPRVPLHHSLGDESVLLPGRAQPVHVHAPVRNYYLMRNTIILVGRDIMPWRWRVRYCYWALKYAAFNALAVDRLPERRALLWRGFRDGLRGRRGRLGS
ncbi:MAG: glycosyltransferase family 2 protein [Ancrocorticia sp.]